MRKLIRTIVIALQVRLFQAWVMDRHETGHPVEWLLYHGYGACGRLANAMRPR